MLTFYGYPQCGTCRKAQKWLDDHQVAYEFIHIVEHPPSIKELKKILQLSGKPIAKLFNTSGQRYREVGMKDKMKDTSEDELLGWLASDGMLIKRPLTEDGEHATVGFNETLFEDVWGSKQG